MLNFYNIFFTKSVTPCYVSGSLEKRKKNLTFFNTRLSLSPAYEFPAGQALTNILYSTFKRSQTALVPNPCSTTMSILVIDIDEVNRILVRMDHEQDKHIIMECEYGLTALEQTATSPFALILFDIKIVRMDG